MTTKLVFNNSIRIFKFPSQELLLTLNEYIVKNVKGVNQNFSLSYRNNEGQQLYINSEQELVDFSKNSEIPKKIYIQQKSYEEIKDDDILESQSIDQQNKAQNDEESKQKQENQEKPQELFTELQQMLDEFQNIHLQKDQEKVKQLMQRFHQIMNRPENLNRVCEIIPFLQQNSGQIFQIIQNQAPIIKECMQSGFKSFQEQCPQIFGVFNNIKQDFCENMKLQGKIQKVIQLLGYGQSEDFQSIVKENLDLDCTQIANLILLQKTIFESQNQQQEQNEEKFKINYDAHTQQQSTLLAEILGGEQSNYYKVVDYYKNSNHDLTWIVDKIMQDDSFMKKFE